MGIKVNNYLGRNDNLEVIDKKGMFTVYKHLEDQSVSPSDAQMKYFMREMDVCKKHMLIQTQGGKVTLNPGAMKMMTGGLQMTSGIKGAGDFLKKGLMASASGTETVKPEYTGDGFIITEPTYCHILLEDMKDWGNSVVLDDGIFLASEGTVRHKVERRHNVSSAVAGGEGLFNLRLDGNGVFAVVSPFQRDELLEVVLENSEFKIDGNDAIMWSSSLQFTTERSGKSLLGSAASGEGLVNVYRGTGRILIAH